MIVGIIDSGINEEHAAFGRRPKIIGKHHFFKDADGKLHEDHDVRDDIGHGTGVCWIINNYIVNSEFIIFKIFGNDIDTDEDVLLHVFEYIRDNNVRCDILNVSAGIQSGSYVSQFESLCNDLYKSGTIIVSAFDNEGGLSYPACFDSVIGVDISMSCFRPRDYYYIENSPINVRGFGYTQKLPSLQGMFLEQRGASFTAPIIVGMLGKAKAEGDADDVMDFLKRNAKVCYSGIYEKNDICLGIRSAAIFPVAKETKTLIEHAEMLPFEIKRVYDIKYSGNIGKNLSQIVYPGCKLESYLEQVVVESIEQVQLSGIDTLILGHINMLQVASGNENIKECLIRKAHESGVKVYMFDDIGVSKITDDDMDGKGQNTICPNIGTKNVPRQRYGRLYRSSVPMLGVFGTSPKQGKFTVQLNLRKRLSEVGYKVANIGTEPTAALFGFEETYPIGYNSMVSISGEDAVTYLNERVHCIEKTNPDIIIVGSQSQSVSSGGESIGYMSIRQHELILGTWPDAYILLVNITDDKEYISRTISFLSSVTPAKVIALVASPIVYQIKAGYQTKVLRYVGNEEMTRFLSELEEGYGVDSYSLNDPNLGEKLQIVIETFFS